MKRVEVVAAVITDNRGRVLATERGYGAMAGGWEFPGGKIEHGETTVDALKREILEELKVHIDVGELIDIVEHDYPDFHLSMACYRCRLADDSRHVTLLEHREARWLEVNDSLPSAVAWLPADLKVLATLLNRQE